MDSSTIRSGDKPGAVLVTGRRGLHRQPRRQGADGNRPADRHLRQPVRGASPGGARRRPRRRRYPRRQLLRSVISSRGVTAVMHFAAWAAVGESVRDPAGYYSNNVEGTLTVLRAMVEEGVNHFIFSSTCAVFGEPLEVPCRRGTRRARSTRTAKRSWPSNARFRTTSAPTASVLSACGTSTQPGADPDGQLGEDHHPERHLIPLALEAAVGAQLPAGVRRRLPDAGRDVPSRLHPRDGPGAGAHPGTRGAGIREASTAYNLGNGRAHSVRDVLQAVARVTGRQVPHTVAPGGRATPPCSTRQRANPGRNLGGRRDFADLDAIIATAWRWFQSHPHKYSGPARMSPIILRVPRRSCRSAPLGRHARLQRA